MPLDIGTENRQAFTAMKNEKLISAVVNNIIRIARDPEFYGVTLSPQNGAPLVTYKGHDVVTLYSVDVNLTAPDVEKVFTFLEFGRFPEGVVVGLYRFDGEPDRVSVDVNVLVPQEHRANSLRFAAENGQQSIFDLERGECIPTGGNGVAKLSRGCDAIGVVRDLRAGLSVFD